MGCICRVGRIKPFPIETSSWDRGPWRGISSESLGEYMGNLPVHRPVARVKISYTDSALYLMFRVKDRYVRSVAVADQGEVYKDSCVEFFFTPGPDLSLGYFNLEMNSGGTMLFHFQPRPRKDRIPVSADDCRKVRRTHSLPRIVDPEIIEPVTWIVAYAIPFSVVEKYCRAVRPGPGSIWRGNFYKCGDQTSHPHWLTWSPVDSPDPDFHRPQSFGRLEFG